MSKKITREEFLSRFYRNYPNANIQLINYTAISNPLEIECKRCGKHYTKMRARDFLISYACCGNNSNISKIEKLKKIYSNSKEFDFVKQVDKDHFIVRHRACGQEQKRVICNSLDNPFSCKYCETNKKIQSLSIDEVQDTLDNRFGRNIKILQYNGQQKKNYYKCLKCGLIFIKKQTYLMQSRGCPKCDRNQSIGEKKIRKILEQYQICFKEQVSVPELPLQKFDFGIYEKGEIQYFIEIQGEQHREERPIFRDGLEKIQERDKRKRDYCSNHNIPLYEIIYQKGKLLNLDILPFSSTTISAKESTLPAEW